MGNGVELRSAAAGLAVAAALAGCGTGAPDGEGSASSAPPSPASAPPEATTAPPGSSTSRIDVPEADYSDPESVAAAFYVAWGSYDGAYDTDERFVERYRPYVSETFLDEHRDEGVRIPTKLLNEAREAQQLATINVEEVSVPPTAPDRKEEVVYRLDGTSTTRSPEGAGGNAVPTRIEVRLYRHDDDRWLVEEVLFD